MYVCRTDGCCIWMLPSHVEGYGGANACAVLFFYFFSLGNSSIAHIILSLRRMVVCIPSFSCTPSLYHGAVELLLELNLPASPPDTTFSYFFFFFFLFLYSLFVTRRKIVSLFLLFLTTHQRQPPTLTPTPP